jgi:CBS domain-containing protein
MPDLQVRDRMTTKPFAIRHDKKMIVVQEVMSWRRIRHVPVVDAQDRLVGIISHRDLLHAALSSVATAPEVERRQHLAQIAIDKVMRTAVTTIGPDAPIEEAARLMREGKIGCLPVIEEGRLVGIITEYDLLGVVENAAARGSDALHRRD